MRILPAIVGPNLATPALVVIGFAWMQQPLPSDDPYDPFLLPTLLILPVMALCGRVLLSWLPPGRVGGHGPLELPVTWAASHLLGFVGFSLWTSFLLWISVFVSFVPGPGVGLLLLLGPWVAAGLVRFATRPGAMVPRHLPTTEPLSSRQDSVRFALRGLFFLCVVMRGFLTEPPSQRDGLYSLLALFDEVMAPNVLAAAHLLAIGILLDHGLRTLRLAPMGSLVVWSVCALNLLILFAPPNIQLSTLGHTAGVAFALAWWRRGSERSLWLSIAGWTAVGLSGLFVNALGGLLLLVVVTPSPSRLLVLRRIAVPAGAVAIAITLTESISVGDFTFSEKSLHALLPIGAMLLGSIFVRTEEVR